MSVALNNIDEIIKLIKAAANPTEAKESLVVKTWKGSVIKELIGDRDMAMFKPEDLPAELGLQKMATIDCLFSRHKPFLI